MRRAAGGGELMLMARPAVLYAVATTVRHGTSVPYE